MATPNIIDVSPAPSSQGIILKEQIRVIFDREMDETSINSGSFVLIGPDRKTVFSPLDLNPFDVSGIDEEDVGSSPYVDGYIKASITFEKVDENGDPVDLKDYTGDGTLWRTVAVLTPDSPLEPDKDYVVTVAGDETPEDDFNSGVTSRTVFDTQKTAGTGDAELNFYGGYTGDVTKTYVVRFTSAGAVGVATYEWWDANDPLTVKAGVSTTGKRELKDGIFVVSEPDGDFAIGDTFTVVATPLYVLEDNYRWEFSTGNGSIVVPPSTSSASGIESISSTTEDLSTFRVTSITPEERKYGVEYSIVEGEGDVIVLTFSADLDPATLVDNLIVRSEPAAGPDISALGDLEFTYVVSDSTLTITIEQGQLYTNNLVITELNTNVMNIDGVSLGTDYISYFTTPYTPLYTELRRIQFEMGSLAAGIPEETIMLAILEASLAADAITFVEGTSEYFRFARREFTTCYAQMLLLKGLSGDISLSERMTKTLGDLKVSRGGFGLDEKMQKLEDCVAYWKVPLTTGGDVTPGASLRPQVAVKGAWAEDAIQVGRQWEPTSGVGFDSMSSANTSRYASGRRRVRTQRRR